MGAAEQIEIHGEKGGNSKPKSPVEASDNLRSTNLAKLLIAEGEGEFDEIPTDYDIYLENTPIRDARSGFESGTYIYQYIVQVSGSPDIVVAKRINQVPDL